MLAPSVGEQHHDLQKQGPPQLKQGARKLESFVKWTLLGCQGLRGEEHGH